MKTISKFLNQGHRQSAIQGITKIILFDIKQCVPDLEITDESIDLISQAAAFHDLGKLLIPAKILNKPDWLTQEEFNIIKCHPQYGCKILKVLSYRFPDQQFFQYCYLICRYHHERYDGAGYPDRLSGEEIPLCAQVVAIADAYDALIQERPYKKAFSSEAAIQMIADGACGAFSPVLIHSLINSAQRIQQQIYPG